MHVSERDFLKEYIKKVSSFISKRSLKEAQIPKLVVLPGTPGSSTSKTDRHDITEIFLKVVLNKEFGLLLDSFSK
jgi:hypothetical protein